MFFRFALGLSVILLLALPGRAHAYLDPASGSMILQVLLGGIAGAALFVRLYWQKVRRFLGMDKDGHEGSSD